MEENAAPELPSYSPPPPKGESWAWYFIILIILVIAGIFIYKKFF